MHSTEAEIAIPSALLKSPGFRLEHVEVLNWGTFNKRIWRIKTQGENALLTGDIGSGKSTLVDALTTLLVPSHRVTYNKAAGAETRERSLASYVRGYYKSEKDDERLAAKSVALRGIGSYSVILGRFRNEHFDETVTLAQVFWMKDDKGQPERFHLVAEHELTIARDFSGFGVDIQELKKRLRKMDGVALHDSFAAYGQDFRRRMGLASEQALDLFYQTVSMKAVSNITEFVRSHMLEDPDIEPRIIELCRLFDNLNAAHEAVIKAEAQVARLTPLVGNCRSHAVLVASTTESERLREALAAWMAQRKQGLLNELMSRLNLDLHRMADEARQQQTAIAQYHEQQSQLKQSIADNGGRRIEEIAAQITQLEQQRERRKAAYEDYARACQQLELPRAQSLDTFHDNRRKASELKNKLEQEKVQHTHERDQLNIALHAVDKKYSELSAEISSLKQRKSNIDSRMLLLRASLCKELNIAESALPFAGELLQVRKEDSLWEGAIERVLHGFGLSLLVSETHYSAVAAYVNRTHLAGRLVYFRTASEVRAAAMPSTHSLLGKIEIKADSPCYLWLESELARGYDYVCCAELDEFRRHPKALTPQGQLKSGGVRHEKDDRSRIDDRSRYVLGWSNEGKIHALQTQLAHQQSEGDALLAQRAQTDTALSRLDTHQAALLELLRPAEFSLIDWAQSAAQIQKLHDEQRALQQSSDVLRALNEQLAETATQLAASNTQLGELQSGIGSKKTELSNAQSDLLDAQKILAQLPENERAFCFASLDKNAVEALSGKLPNTPKQCSDAETQLRKWLQARIDSTRKKAGEIAHLIIVAMQQYIAAYPADCREVNASLDSSAAFQLMLNHLMAEDLPRFKSKFKELLNKNTINEVALLQDKLDQESRTIQKKIDLINRSLKQIEYGSGTYIQLVPDPDPDMEIRQFKEDLKGCLANTMAGVGDELYTEHRFALVKKIIDRFNGRQDTSNADRSWMRKVTDVRNWYRFSASERWQSDHSEKEFYSDSAGKSGGQKEKLAYTILASALAYQFGLSLADASPPSRATRTFCFVMIDEAFGRGSDESARYGLELFAKLGLQLLIVTPLQKIHVIENYVRSVHLVHNNNGNDSVLRSLTIAEYHAEKARLQAVTP
ncbi:MAG: ATP-binding protein [Gallionella sp.]